MKNEACGAAWPVSVVAVALVTHGLTSSDGTYSWVSELLNRASIESCLDASFNQPITNT